MKVLDIYVTEGVSINGKKKTEWTSRTAVCCDYFKSKDGEGEFIRIFKLSKDCPSPEEGADVRPLFDERGRVASWVCEDSDQ